MSSGDSPKRWHYPCKLRNSSYHLSSCRQNIEDLLPTCVQCDHESSNSFFCSTSIATSFKGIALNVRILQLVMVNLVRSSTSIHWFVAVCSRNYQPFMASVRQIVYPYTIPYLHNLTISSYIPTASLSNILHKPPVWYSEAIFLNIMTNISYTDIHYLPWHMRSRAHLQGHSKTTCACRCMHWQYTCWHWCW